MIPYPHWALSPGPPPVPAGGLPGAGGHFGSLKFPWWETGLTKTSVPADGMAPVAPNFPHPEVPHHLSEESEIL